MIICPNCRQQVLIGSLFCGECGFQLVNTGHLTTHSFYKGNQDAPGGTGPLISKPEQPPAGAQQDPHVSLFLLDSGQVLQLVGKTEFMLGRVGEKQPILPDVDLTEYQAYAHGVSRLHASLRIMDQMITITDLGSSNGTRINGQKILPNVEYPLQHGDVIALGKLKIQILIR